MKSAFIGGTLIGLAFALSGCGTAPAVFVRPEIPQARLSDFIALNYAAADHLMATAANELTKDVPILVATTVNIDDLEQSSSFGRMLSEHVSARFSQSRYQMVEMKLQNHVYMKNNVGELMLTRNISEIATNNKAQAVIAGTYYAGTDSVTVNLKLVQPQTHVVLAATDYVVPLNAVTANMLGWKPAKSPTYELKVTGDTCEVGKICVPR